MRGRMLIHVNSLSLWGLLYIRWFFSLNPSQIRLDHLAKPTGWNWVFRESNLSVENGGCRCWTKTLRELLMTFGAIFLFFPSFPSRLLPVGGRDVVGIMLFLLDMSRKQPTSPPQLFDFIGFIGSRPNWPTEFFHGRSAFQPPVAMKRFLSVCVTALLAAAEDCENDELQLLQLHATGQPWEQKKHWPATVRCVFFDVLTGLDQSMRISGHQTWLQKITN